MDCKRIQELLPLYVGCDLNEKLAKSISAHLQFCTRCANSVDDYRETRQLLRRYEPPALSDDFYASLRQQVLEKIIQASDAQGVHVFATSLFHPRLRWALATALLFAGCALTLYVSSMRTEEHQQLANDSRAVDRTMPKATRDAPLPDKSKVRSSSSNNTNEQVRQRVSKGRNSASAIARSIERLKERTNRGVGGNQSEFEVRNEGSAAVQAVMKEGILTKPDEPTAGDPPSSQKTMRMEIQTKDRNIRIIWFSSQHDKRGSSNESSQGT